MINIKGKYIYKITNIVNNKSYIGQSINPKKRFTNHMRVKNKHIENKKFNDDLIIYGKSNFRLEILGYFYNYNEMEIKYIKEYDSINNGYNKHIGGISPKIIKGEDSHYSKLKAKEVELIKYSLKTSNYSSDLIKNIANSFGVSSSAINRINNGEYWYDSSEQYPLNKGNSGIGNKIKDKIINTDMSLKEIAIHFNVTYSRVKAINSGQNQKENLLIYPLKSNIELNKLKLEDSK